MKSILKTFTLLLFVLLISSVAEAQIKNLLKEKAIETIGNKKAEEDKKREQEKRQEQEKNQSQTQTQSSRPSKGPSALERRMMQAVGLNNVKYDLQYNFTSSMVMDIETIDSLKNLDKVQYTTMFNPNDKNFALQFESVDKETGSKKKTLMIFDMKNSAMLILGEENGERSGMAMQLDPDSTESSNEEVEDSEVYQGEFVHPFYSPTGRTKSIAGFSCKEYAYKNEAGSVNLWVTNDSKLNLSKAYGHMQGFQALSTGGWAYGMGTVMEMMWIDNDSTAQTKMLVKDIQPNSPKRLDLTGYSIIGIGGGK
jgi:hypothetical protein